jgi:hypothetical protein
MKVVNEMLECIMLLFGVLAHLIYQIFKLMKKAIKGFNYCFLKKPCLYKFLGLFISTAMGILFILYTSSHVGILSLTGIMIPIFYLSAFSKKLDSHKYIQHLMSLEDSEQELFFNELMKDEEFKTSIYQGFLKDREKERKQQKKNTKIEIEPIGQVSDEEDSFNDFDDRFYRNRNLL